MFLFVKSVKNRQFLFLYYGTYSVSSVELQGISVMGKSQIKSQKFPEMTLNQLAKSQAPFHSHPKPFKSNFKSHHDLLTRVFVVQGRVFKSHEIVS